MLKQLRSFLHSVVGGGEPKRAIILGLDAAGKTTLLYKLTNKFDDIVTTIPTIGFNVETLENHKMNLTCWDIGGCDKIRPLWRHYFDGCALLVFVVDSNDHERFENAKEEFSYFLKDDTMLLNSVPILFIVNKMDLPGARTPQEIIRIFELNRIANRQVFVLPTSLPSSIGLENVVLNIKALLSPRHQHLRPVGLVDVQLHEQPDQGEPACDDSHQSINKDEDVSILKIESVTLEVGVSSSSNSLGQPSSAELSENTEQENTDNSSNLSYQPTMADIEKAMAEKEIERRRITFQHWIDREDLPDDDFLEAIDNYSLDSWDHYVHVRLGWLLITRHGVTQGFERAATAIRNYIQLSPHGNGGKSFHCTMTHFWCHVIAAVVLQQCEAVAVALEEGGVLAMSSVAGDFKQYLRFARDSEQVDLTSGSLFKHWFTNSLLFSAGARQGLVEPDIKPLPDISVLISLTDH